jgi:DNA modification methylase
VAWTLLQGDCLEQLKTLPDESIHCCVTSPPYWGLRDWGVDGQMGLEPTPEEYVASMVEVFREVKRVLRKDGTLWLNLGDSYIANKIGGLSQKPSLITGGRDTQLKASYRPDKKADGLKPKDLVGIPWRVAFALQADGWYLRSDIIWGKPNPMPESVTDRPTKAHEYIFLLSVSPRYYYDAAAIREESVYAGTNTGVGFGHGTDKELRKRKRVTDKQRGHSRRHAGFNDRWGQMTKEEQASMGRNKKTVWIVATRPFTEAHFATFPPKLIVPCILAGCPEGGMVLDPFAGAGTTLWVAEQLDRNSIGIELNPEYCEIIRRRMARIEPNLFNLGQG